MRPGSSPNVVSDFQPFPQLTLSCLDSEPSGGAFSGVSKDGKVCWIVKGSMLQVVDLGTRACLAAWQFGQVLGDSHTSITCVEEIHYGQSRKLVVGVCNSSPTGLICVFDVAVAKVVNAVEIPHQVSEVEVICTSVKEESVPRWALSEHLRIFCGLVAVGTNSGHVFLVDLCIDDNEFVSDEVTPGKLHFMTPRSRNIENERFHCMSQGLHLCMHLNAESFTHNGYQYQKPDGIVMKTLRPEVVSITCLKYIPQAGILTVGFSFGCYQLWKLHIPVLEYSSRLESDPYPVTHIAYQEPENDPKNFCYLWVARGPLLSDEEPGMDTVSTICMYQLAFSKKSFYSNYGVFYEDLASVCVRLDQELTSTPVQTGSNYEGGSKVVSCYTLVDPHYQPPSRLDDDESFEESVHGPDLSLCVFVWEAYEGSTATNRQLAIFDINRWYHAQMPSTVRFTGGTVETCSYFAFCQLDKALDMLETENLLAVHVSVDTLRKFLSNSPMPPEQHFYPASLAFDTTLILELGIVQAQFLGSQRQVLANIEAQGPTALLQPHDLYSLCVYMGLLPRPADVASQNPSLVFQRECLLTLALEYNMLTFLRSCISQWARGEYEHQGCTLKCLLDWAWEKVSSTKHQTDSLCVNLYNWSGLQLDRRSLETLVQANQRFANLICLFKVFTSQAGPITEQGQTDLQSKILVTSLISHHLSAVLWFVNAGLLPENDEEEELVGNQYSYPVASLIQAYNGRRAELHGIHSDIDETHLLMIDGLVADVGVHDLWDREGGNGRYPPPSLHALLSTYLLENVDMVVKQCVVLYLLIDLVSVDSSADSEQFSEKVSGFASHFNLPPSLVKLIQGFWLLDHKDFEESLVLMLDPMVTAEFSRWQHGRVIKSLLYQGDSKMALRYIITARPALSTPEEVKLKLTVLLANGHTAEALEYVRVCRDQANMQDLLSHLFVGCQQTKTVDRLLQLPLTPQEENQLVEYLLESGEPNSHEMLVMYYLQHAKFVEAIQLNDKLKQSVLMESNAKTRERAASRNAIVDSFSAILPHVQRKLLFEQIHVPKKNTQWRREVRRPTPLSTKITKSKTAVVSQSAFIMTIMEKLDEIEPEERPEDVHNKSVGPFVCTPVTPARKSQRNTPAIVFPDIEEKNRSGGISLHKTLPIFQNDTPTAADRRRTNYYSASCLTLLATPKVQKMTPRKQLRVSSATVLTPQSILKVRNLISTTSPSPHSTNVTPNSGELDTSAKKHIPRKLGYGAGSQPGTPRSVSFSDGPLSSIPRHLAAELSQPSSPRSVSFAEASTSNDAPTKTSHDAPLSRPVSQPSTPKSVSFVDIVEDEESVFTPRPVSMAVRFGVTRKQSQSTESPTRSVRDRSPTPESAERSPKFTSQLDQLIRPPLRSPDQLPLPQAGEISDSGSNISDDDVEEMEASYETATSPGFDTSVTSTATVRSPGQQKKPSPQKSPEKSPQSMKFSPEKSQNFSLKPGSPTVKMSKTAISMHSVAADSHEHVQTTQTLTEHAQTVTQTYSSQRTVINTEIISEPVNIDLTMDDSSEQMDVDENVSGSPTDNKESREIFSADEEICHNDEGAMAHRLPEADVDGEVVSSSDEQMDGGVAQEVKIEPDYHGEEFIEPPSLARQLEPPPQLRVSPQRSHSPPLQLQLDSSPEPQASSPEKLESPTKQSPSPAKQSPSPEKQSPSESQSPEKQSPSSVKQSPSLVNQITPQSSPPSSPEAVVMKVSPEFENKIHDNFLREIDNKFADTPMNETRDRIASVKTEPDTTTSQATRRRKTFNAPIVMAETEDVPLTPTRLTRARLRAMSEEPVTPTRSSRRTKVQDKTVDDQPQTPTRSSRRKNPTETASPSSHTLTRSSRRKSVKEEIVEVTAVSPKPFSRRAKQAVQESIEQLAEELVDAQNAEINTSPVKPVKPATPTRSHHKSIKTEQSNVVRISAVLPKQFTSEAKEAVQDSIQQLAEELNDAHSSRETSPVDMTKIKDKENIPHISPPSTPTRSTRKQKNQLVLTPTRRSSRIAHKDDDESLLLTPTRTRGGKKTDTAASPSRNKTTPTRGRKAADKTSPKHSPSRNKSNNSSPVRTPDINILVELNSLAEVVEIQRTPNRGRRKKSESSNLIADKTIETSALPVSPATSSRLQDEDDLGPLPPSRRHSIGRSVKVEAEINLNSNSLDSETLRRQSFAHSGIKFDEFTDISEEPVTPSRRHSIGRSCKKEVSEMEADSEVPKGRRNSISRSSKQTSDKSLSPERGPSEKNTVSTPTRGRRNRKATISPERETGAKAVDEKANLDKDNIEAKLTETVKLTPSRQNRGRKTKDAEESIISDTKVENEKLTPSRSKRAKKEATVEEKPAIGGEVSAMPGLYDIQPASFQFADPMQVDEAEEPNMPKPFTPVKSFIFSPPISRVRDLQSVVSEAREGILLPPGPSTAEVVPKSQVRNKKMRKLYKEDEEVLLISPGALGKDDSGSDGLGIITRTARGAMKRVKTTKDGTKLVLRSLHSGRRVARFGPVGQKKKTK